MVMQVMPLINKQGEKCTKLKSIKFSCFQLMTAFGSETFLSGEYKYSFKC